MENNVAAGSRLVNDDSFDLQRVSMVENQLQRRGIRDRRVLDAFLSVPRHEFVPEKLRKQAYRDVPLPIGEGQTISQPYMVAVMTELAAVNPDDKVLDVGTGSGYQTAILAALGAEVYSIERVPSLMAMASQVLQRLGYDRIRLKVGDGTLGWDDEAPFDAILVTAGAPALPEPLLEQLKVGGRLVVPIEEGISQVLYRLVRTEQGYQKERGDRCTFVPLIGEYGWKGPTE
jgi:protein-L-isoaspartate(D-aspartate) O-methyltransferase